MNLVYPGLRKTIKAELTHGRAESRAFLPWFLRNHYRPDELDVVDAACDGPDDKGTSAIYVDHNLETVKVLFATLLVWRNLTSMSHERAGAFRACKDWSARAEYHFWRELERKLTSSGA